MAQSRREDSGATVMPLWQQILSAVTGIVFLVTLMAVALFVPSPSDFQGLVFRTVLALAAGAFATIVSGFIHVHARWQRISIRAGAGLAVFVVIYLVDPPSRIRQLSSTIGFIPPETIRSGDKSAALVVPPDGSVLSLLPDRLVVDLQGAASALQDTVTTAMSIQITKVDGNLAESVVNHIRGAIMLSRDADATVTVNVGGRIAQYDFPVGDKPTMTLKGDIYQLTDFFRQITTPVDLSSNNVSGARYPITLSIFARRASLSDIAYVAIDSLDAALQFEGRGK